MYRTLHPWVAPVDRHPGEPRPVTPRQIDLVRDSFVHILFAADEASTIFYDRVFALAPESRALFTNDRIVQGRLFMQTLAKIVTGLTAFEAMRPELRALGRRHVAYGAKDHHYAIIGDALRHVVAHFAGADFDPDTDQAWQDAYDLVARVMIEASHEHHV